MAVKLASARKLGARSMLLERQRRGRMAAQPLRAQYPRASSIRLDLAFTDQTAVLPAPQSIVLHPPARAYFVFPCPYGDCDGQFDLTAAVSELQQSRHTHGDGKCECSGHRAPDAKGPKPCGLHLEYSIDVNLDAQS